MGTFLSTRKETFDALTNERISNLLSDESYLNDYMKYDPDEACIRTLMSRATMQNNKRAMKIILEFIVRQLKQRFRDDTSVRIWAGEEMTEKDNRNTVLVCFYDSFCDSSLKYFYDLRIIYRKYNAIDDESSTARLQEQYQNRYMTKQKHDLVHEAIKIHGKRLFEDHTNLGAISSGSIISSKSRGLVSDVCVIAYCRLKGVIPFGEEPFPKKLKVNSKESVVLDVREGFFSNHSDDLKCLFRNSKPSVSLLTESPLSILTEPPLSPLRMGCSIGAVGDNIIGTLGPFVRINQHKFGFLTCAHVLSGNQPTQSGMNKIRGKSVVQPGDSNAICGRVVTAVFNGSWTDSTSNQTIQNNDNRYIPAFGIDAAVVEITSRIPIAGDFELKDQTQLGEEGFSADKPLRFNTGEFMTSPIDDVHRAVIKVGHETGLTRGFLYLEDGKVRYSSLNANLKSVNGTTENIEIWHGLMQILPKIHNRFSAAGDSGAGIFIVGNENKLTCIGIMIGALSDGVGIATPIDKVLAALKHDCRLMIELQPFSPDVEMAEV